VGVVECARYGRDDAHDLIGWHTGGISVSKKAGTIHTVDKVHRDPQLAVELTPIVDTDDVRVIQGGREIGLTEEPGAIFRISRYVCR